MCGILGNISQNINERIFQNALKSIAHRGPDGEGVWQNEERNVILGHRRLSILDLSDQGKQPMHFDDYVITYNGEIYNFPELKKELKSKGYNFQTDCDTEVVLAAFKEWQHNCLLKFNGMWALAIWNKKSKELFISRDRFGKKPLFYSFENDQFVFCSEMKGILPFLSHTRPSKDFEWCKSNIFNYESTEKCLIEGIKRFPAGHFAYLKAPYNKITPVRYWNTLEHLEEVPTSYKDQVERFRELFIDACKIRMRADVSIGTALSGGLDSSATICTMAHIGNTVSEKHIARDWQHAFVATFPNSFLDETKYARKVIEYTGVKSTFLPIHPPKIDSLLNDLYLFEELYITSPVPMMNTYKAIRENGVFVTIDGHGADELFSGYGKDILLAIKDAGFNYKAINTIIQTYQNLYEADVKETSIQRLKNKDSYQLLIGQFGGHKNFIKHLFKQGLGLNIKENSSKGIYGNLNKYLYSIFHETILPTLLRNYDRYSMAHGIEIRMPFMDHRLVTYSFSLPWESKLNKGFTKTIIRDAVKDLVPEEIIWRSSKIGFNTPIVDWMKGEWKEYLLDEIHSQSFKESDLIDSTKVAKQINEVITNPNAQFVDGQTAWTSLTPYLWGKAFLVPQTNN